MEGVKTAYKYWFRFGSPVAFGVFRALMSGLIFVNLCMLSIYFQDFYSNKGYMPADLCARWLDTDVFLIQGSDFNINRINPLYGVTNDAIILGAFWLTTVAALFSALGLHTRISTIVMALGMITLHHRNPMLLHGGDTAMRIGAIYLAIGSSGAAFSLDRFFAVKKGLADSTPKLVSMWPQRLVQFNLALIYFTTTWAKWFGGLWKSGDATWYPARLHEFDRFPVPEFINQYPVIKISTYGTLLVEFSLATLIWFKPLRKYVLLAGIGMHAFIEYSMNIPLFAFVMVSFYICFYEGEEVASWWDRLKLRFAKRSV